MEYRFLGQTGLQVSPLSLGTVGLGMDYGIQAPGVYGRPGESEARRLILAAADAGINFFDTARAYGVSEEILGKTLADKPYCYVATKISLPKKETRDKNHIKQIIKNSLQESQRMLQRKVLDIVQIHNATTATFKDGRVIEALKQAKMEGKIRYIGASVYGEDAALIAIESGTIDTLQIAYSLVDQRAKNHVLPAAQNAGVGVMARSILLKGALTPKARYLPSHLRSLVEAAERVRKAFDVSWDELPQLAIRFCMGISEIDVLILGISSKKELDEALKAIDAGPLSNREMEQMREFGLDDEQLLNPSYWGIP
ncbi:MAG: aldo/keto reductase [Candidatus Hodarchaeota archaeon]